MRYSEVIPRLVAHIPEFEPVYREHVEDYEGEVLAHLVFADLARFVLAAYERSDRALVRRCLSFLEQALVAGDDATQNLVVVSFIENIAPDDLRKRRALNERPDTLVRGTSESGRDEELRRFGEGRCRRTLWSQLPRHRFPASLMWSCQPSRLSGGSSARRTPIALVGRGSLSHRPEHRTHASPTARRRRIRQRRATATSAV